MGGLRNVVVGRWLVRWLLRGSPVAVVLKLAGVALWGAWRWRRERRAEEARRPKELRADYEVVPPGRLPGPEPRAAAPGTAAGSAGGPSSTPGTTPGHTAGGTPPESFDRPHGPG